MERTKLISARAKKHWTLEQAAEYLEVDDNTLYRWEKGKATPRGYNIQKLCDVYGMTERELGLEANAVTQPTEQLSREHRMFVSSDLTMQLLALAFTPFTDFQTVLTRLMQIIKEFDAMINDPITRRDALRRLATLPAIFSIPLSASEYFSQYTASIAACWQLSKSRDETDIDLAFQGASTYASQLKAKIATASSEQQGKALASLVGQCALLRTILGWHVEGIKEAAIYAQEALFYSEKAADIPLQISVHVQLAWIYYYAGQYKRSLEAADRAAALLKESAAPLPSSLHSSVHTTHAIRQAMYSQDQEALTSLHLAMHSFFERSDDEIPFIFVDYDQPSLFLEGGIAYAKLGKHDTALQSFEKVLGPDLTPKIPVAERVRIEVLNNQTISLLKIKEKDMEKTLRSWEFAINGARQLQSEQRFNEALIAYDIMEAVWPGEKRIKGLRELTIHW